MTPSESPVGRLGSSPYLFAPLVGLITIIEMAETASASEANREMVVGRSFLTARVPETPEKKAAITAQHRVRMAWIDVLSASCSLLVIRQ